MDMYRRRGGRARALTLAAFALTVGLAGCGVSPSDTPPGPPPPPAFTGTAVTASDHSVAVRDLFVIDPGEAGYKAGGKAPLSMHLWNNTTASISLVGATLNAKPLELVGGTEATSKTFDVPVPAGGNLPLSQAAGRYLQVPCLPGDVPAGATLSIVFTFSNKATVTADVPVGRFGPDGKPLPTGAASATC